MLHQLQLPNGPNSVTLTYDGLGLRIEGGVDVEQRGSRRSLSDLTLLPIAKVNLLRIALDPSQRVLRVHALIPREQAIPDSPLDLCIFSGPVDHAKIPEAQQFCQAVLDHVYQDTKLEKRLKVLINPFGGQALARKMFREKVAPIFESAGCTTDVQETEYRGHAVEIAKTLDVDAYDAIVTVSGDGVIHEVINGLCQRPDARLALKKLPLGVIPGGTGNALSICMLGEKLGFDAVHTARQVVKGKPMALDLCSVTYDDHRYMSFLSQSYGISAYADLATENLRWMGDARIVLGLLHQMFTGKSYKIEMSAQIVEAAKDKIISNFSSEAKKHSPSEGDGPIEDTIPPLSEPVPDHWTTINGDISLLMASKAPWIGRGLFSHPLAFANDGLLDMMLVRDNQSLFSKLNMFSKVDTGDHIGLDAVEYYKVRAFRFKPIPKPGKKAYLAIDGEHAPVKEFQLEVHPGLAYTLSLYPDFENVRSYHPAGIQTASSPSPFTKKLRTIKNKLCGALSYVLSIIRRYFGRLGRIFKRSSTR